MLIWILRLRRKKKKYPYRATFDRTIDIIHTDLDLKFDWENRQVIGVAKLDITPVFYPIKKDRFRWEKYGCQICFHLVW